MRARALLQALSGDLIVDFIDKTIEEQDQDWLRQVPGTQKYLTRGTGTPVWGERAPPKVLTLVFIEIAGATIRHIVWRRHGLAGRGDSCVPDPAPFHNSGALSMHAIPSLFPRKCVPLLVTANDVVRSTGACPILRPRHQRLRW